MGSCLREEAVSSQAVSTKNKMLIIFKDKRRKHVGCSWVHADIYIYAKTHMQCAIRVLTACSRLMPTGHSFQSFRCSFNK